MLEQVICFWYFILKNSDVKFKGNFILVVKSELINITPAWDKENLCRSDVKMDLHFQTLLTTAVSDFRDNNPREQFYFLSFTCPLAPRWRIGPRTSFPFRINSTILCPECPTFFRLKAAPAERSEKGYGDENVL